MKAFWGELALVLLALSIVAATVAAPAPVGPTNLTARGEYEGGVAVAKLAWKDESDNETGFEILRSDNGQKFRVIGFVGANTTQYQDKVGKYITGAFAYQVRAFNQDGKSAESNSASVWF